MYDLLSVAVPPGFDTEPRAAAELIITLIAGAAWVACLVWVLRIGRREGEWAGLALLVGGGLCMVQEPMVDVAGSLYLRSDITVFETWGREMPLWGLFAYSIYWGAFPLALSRFAGRGLSLGDYRRLILGGFVVNLLIELPPLAAGLYEYFGQQPMKVLGLPLFWLTLNCSSAVVIAAVMVRAGDAFTSRRAAAAALLAPVIVPAGSMGTGLAAFTALNSPGVSDGVLWLAAAVTIAVGWVIIELCGRVMTTGSARAAQRPPELTYA